MVPLTDDAAEPEPRATASDAVSEPVADDAAALAASSRRLDRRLNLAIAAAVLVLVALAGWFAWGAWSQDQENLAASPAYQVVAAMKKQVDQKPDDPTLRSRYAEALGAVGRFDDALAQLAVAVKLDPKYVGAYENRALVEILQKDYASAERDLNKVLDLTNGGDYTKVNERRELAYFHLGEISLLKKRYEDAVAYFKAALRIRKDASDTYVRLAQAYVGMDAKDMARKQLDIALKFDPRFAEAHYELGKLDAAAGDKVDAAWEFRAAIDGAPDAQEPQAALATLGTYDEWWGKAVAADKAGKSADALDAVRIARAMEPASFEAAMLNGKLAEATGDLEAAKEAYGTAVKIRPGDADATAALKRVTDAGKKGAK